ncbi:uncharacterized protein LOC122075769 isoform X2 [Macadamia integrifolia]|uniref:uncharacterized protein LOC122075769 isoform X2 n=1 Tax=Macadamia integrifolia TaxID=60698 RepID=UPI001C4E5BB8|nr:uncharacterized protein LOC122075769 isoform X2 [Macadamia integrifolia]
MTHARRLLLPFRAYLVGCSRSNSLFYYPRNTVQWNYEQLKLWVKGFQPVLQDGAVRFQYRLISQRRCIQTLCFSGITLSMGSMSVQGSFYLWPRVAYAMDGEKNTFAEEDNTDLIGGPGLFKDDPYSFRALARKFWLPVFLLLTIFTGWGHPIVLTVKVLLFLLSTNPSPFSVYLFIEQFLNTKLLFYHQQYIKVTSLVA